MLNTCSYFINDIAQDVYTQCHYYYSGYRIIFKMEKWFNKIREIRTFMNDIAG